MTGNYARYWPIWRWSNHGNKGALTSQRRRRYDLRSRASELVERQPHRDFGSLSMAEAGSSGNGGHCPDACIRRLRTPRAWHERVHL